jgi:hypothetical protein
MSWIRLVVMIGMSCGRNGSFDLLNVRTWYCPCLDSLGETGKR